MQMEVREGHSEGVRDRAARLVFGVDLIARHYCGILLDAGHLGQPAHQKQQLSTAQRSAAKAECRSRQREASAQSPIWLEAFSPTFAVATHNCYRTPRMAAEVRRCMYM